ncbi:MAG: hypothetical protein Q8P41_26460 [Pseudomonadota bacterium]|nr:hypothetical protein [Pseudomonadota bacterium]
MLLILSSFSALAGEVSHWGGVSSSTVGGGMVGDGAVWVNFAPIGIEYRVRTDRGNGVDVIVAPAYVLPIDLDINAAIFYHGGSAGPGPRFGWAVGPELSPTFYNGQRLGVGARLGLDWTGDRDRFGLGVYSRSFVGAHLYDLEQVSYGSGLEFTLAWRLGRG